MIDLLRNRIQGKKLLLLGFGREGESSYRVIRNLFPEMQIGIADRNPDVILREGLQGDEHLEFQCGEHYLDDLNRFDMILKSPGISLLKLNEPLDQGKITSQTDIFLEAYGPQVTGVTGTKGKSTTSSLIAHILKTDGQDTVLLGNIGTPAWHFIDCLNPQTRIVDELSSHQLEYIHQGPHIALLLNIFEEHLDAYASYLHYQLAKCKIATTQAPGDYLIFNADDPLISRHLRSVPSTLLPVSLYDQFKSGGFVRGEEVVIRIPGSEELVVRELHNRYLKGKHNLFNTAAAVAACRLLGTSEEAILDGLASFKGLAHRMEEVGNYHGINWVNDSIATIPEACMAAMQSLPGVETLILGGFDRGISYETLARYLNRSPLHTLILVGAAGRRIGDAMEKSDKTIKTRKQLFYINRFDQFLPIALNHTRPGATCLLSPAASSYDEFRSFEERGFRFVELVKGKVE